MGQYHSIYNRTKKEYIRIGGAKLWEQAHSATAAALLLLLSNSNGRGGGDFNLYPKDYDKLTAQEKRDKAIIEAVSGRWAGDSIVVQGDYAEETDPGYISKEDDNYKNVTREVCDALLIADNGDASDVAQIIEEETRSSFGSAKGLSKVEKIESKCRNKRTVQLYTASKK